MTWTQYKLLVRIDDIDKRDFFIAEAIKNAWSVRQMERQINSLLYERLLMSQDKESVLAIARGEKQPLHPQDIIKGPTVLEFLGLKPQAAYYESDLEEAITTHLQEFLLELVLWIINDGYVCMLLFPSCFVARRLQYPVLRPPRVLQAEKIIDSNIYAINNPQL